LRSLAVFFQPGYARIMKESTEPEASRTVIKLLRESGALLEGHFLLSSGRHSDKYFQCARLFQYPDRSAAAFAPVAERIRAGIASGSLAIDAVAGPALGGIIAAYELGRQLGLPALFTERDDTGTMCLRRGFEINPGLRILIAEDVITTGKSSGECAAALEARGAVIAALACMVDRRADADSQYPSSSNPEIPWPLFAAWRAEARDWEADNCEICRQGIPAVKPGSRKL
jgi:orotate phosphoribosyltransferase